MQQYPHRYRAFATGGAEGSVEVGDASLPALATWPPPQFDGPPGHWSPEALLTAAVADCFLLSFRTVAHASKFAWERLDVQVEGTLDRVDGVTRFTEFRIVPRLALANSADAERALKLLDKARRVCLIGNSLKADCVLDLETAVRPAAVPA